METVHENLQERAGWRMKTAQPRKQNARTENVALSVEFLGWRFVVCPIEVSLVG
jgi:hypothetical protein